LVYFLDGWVVGLENYKVIPMPYFDVHTAGYLAIALIYIIMAVK